MATLKIALAKKKVIKSAITKLSTEYQGKTLDAPTIELYDKKYTKLVKELDEVFKDICTDCKEADLDGFVEEQQTISDQLDEIWLDITRERAKLNPVSSTTNGIPNASVARPDTGIDPSIRLPVLSLPNFQGQIRDWLTFSDFFKASVHNNPSLSSVQKLSYLKMALQGDAAKIIQSLPISEDNYATAWALLEERYANKREQIYAHIKKFFTMSTIPSDSPSAILSLVDTVTECVRSLQTLGQKIDEFSEILFCYTINNKLDSNTRMWYERQFTTADQLPKLKPLLDFLKNQARMLQASKNNPSVNYPKHSPVQRATAMLTGDKNSSTTCTMCSDSHKLYLCPQFLKLPVTKRNEFVKKHRLCFVCLQKHLLKNCASLYKCHCGLRHSGTLHFNKPNESNLNRDSEVDKRQQSNSQTTKTFITCDPVPSTPTRSLPLDPNAASFPQDQSNSRNDCFAAAVTKENQKSCSLREPILTTAIIFLKDGTGVYQPVRSIWDSGSTRCFLTRNCADRLRLPKQKLNINVNCLNATKINIKNKVTATISNKYDFERTLEFLLIPKITDKLPYNRINVSPDQLPQVQMADPTWHCPSSVEALLGVECFYELFREGTISVPNTQLNLYKSVFGYIICGTMDIAREGSQNHCGMVCGGTNEKSENRDDLLVQLQKFWEIEGGNLGDSNKNRSKEETICEEHFVLTHTRDSEGKYVVKMPLREDPACLGESRGIAMGRLNANYRRLVKEPAHLKLYNQFMDEYLKLGHMEEVHEKCPPPL